MGESRMSAAWATTWSDGVVVIALADGASVQSTVTFAAIGAGGGRGGAGLGGHAPLDASQLGTAVPVPSVQEN